MPVGTYIDAPPIPVAYVSGDASLPIGEQAPAAIDELATMLGELQRRSFYGIVVGAEYRACVAVRPDARDDTRLPSNRFTVPSGRYFCRRLTGFLDDPTSIDRMIEGLIVDVDHDSSRPVIEYYRGHDQVTIRIPVHATASRESRSDDSVEQRSSADPLT